MADTKGDTSFLCRALVSHGVGIRNLLGWLLLDGEGLIQDVLLVLWNGGQQCCGLLIIGCEAASLVVALQDPSAFWENSAQRTHFNRFSIHDFRDHNVRAGASTAMYGYVLI